MRAKNEVVRYVERGPSVATSRGIGYGYAPSMAASFDAEHSVLRGSRFGSAIVVAVAHFGFCGIEVVTCEHTR